MEYRINARGLRDDELGYIKAPGQFRIVVAGDSNTFGLGVPIEKHYTRLMEGYFQSVAVINLGVDGYGLDQSLLRLRQEGFKYRPDLVLLFLPHYANHRHMHPSRFGLEKPRFSLAGNGELKLENVPDRH